MNLALLTILQCAQCAAHPLAHESFDPPEQVEVGRTDAGRLDAGRIQAGVVWCQGCGIWYPVEDGLLDLLTGSLAYEDDLRRFWATHEARLRRLGLEPRTDESAHDVREQRLQQEHFDWYADNPTQTYRQFEVLPFWRARRGVTLDRRRRLIRPGGRFLDVGCANGRSTMQYVNLDIEIVAFDVSKALVQQAVRRLRDEQPRACVTFLVADASHRLPFETETFDYVLFGGVLHHLTDPGQACREAFRVLRPGGIMFAGENNRSIFRPLFDLLQHRKPLWYEQAGRHAQMSCRELLGWLQAAGFSAEVETSVFMPPHLVNVLPTGIGTALMRLTDWIGTRTPVLRNHGGLISGTGRKRGAAVPELEPAGAR